ncbi:MAG: VOC family protein [Pseudomonadota bacterium]
MKPRISMITLGVDDMARSIQFYEQGLGLPRLDFPPPDPKNPDAPPSVAFFTLHGTWLGLFGLQALAEDANVPSEGSGFNGFALAHNLASEAEVDALYAQIIDAGGKALKTPQKVFWGGYSGYFADPDGHLWELAYNPFMWVGPKDEPATD